MEQVVFVEGMVDSVKNRPSSNLGATTRAEASTPIAKPTTPVAAEAPAKKTWVATGAQVRRPVAAPVSTQAAATSAVSVVRLTGAAAANAPQVGVMLKNPAGELGYLGAIGPSGALGTNGPISENGPSHLITGSFDWSSWSNLMTAWGGPLSMLGPLGANGPLNKLTAASTVSPLKIGGEEAVLGPAGPLGALGPLGPLGPTGAHGYKANASGEYVNSSNKVVRDITVNWDLSRTNTEELVENYTEAKAKKMADNDTSFMVQGSAAKAGDVDTYAFKSRTDQYVTVLVVPTKGAVDPKGPKTASSNSAADLAKNFDDFDLRVTDGSGKVLATSSFRNGPDWVQLKVPAGAQLNAEVELKGSNHAGAKPYRLVVVGTGDHTADMAPGGAWSPISH